MTITMSHIGASKEQLATLMEHGKRIGKRHIYANIDQQGNMLMDYRTGAGFYARKTVNRLGVVISRQFFREYDYPTHTPMKPLFE